jgi:hypothetical protein
MPQAAKLTIKTQKSHSKKFNTKFVITLNWLKRSKKKKGRNCLMLKRGRCG